MQLKKRKHHVALHHDVIAVGRWLEVQNYSLLIFPKVVKTNAARRFFNIIVSRITIHPPGKWFENLLEVYHFIIFEGYKFRRVSSKGIC